MEEVVELTQDLIRFKTMHGNSDEIRRCAGFIEAYFDRHQIAFTRTESNGYPSLRVMPAGDAARVLLMAHIDVVDAPDDLFEPVVENGNLYGRGAIDDKYAAALAMVLVKEHVNRLRSRGLSQTDLPFGILITSDEEIGGYDGVARVIDEITVDFCIALDGGDPTTVVVKEKGLLTLKMIASGKAAHGSRPWLGVNAIDQLIADYGKLKSQFGEAGPGSWVKTMNLSMITAGKSFNQVPDRAEAVFDIRYTENEDVDTLYRGLQALVDSRLVIERKEPIFMGGRSHYLELLQKVVPELQVGFEHGASDARFFSERGIDGIIWGAAGDHSAHARDEHVRIDSLDRLAADLDRFLTAVGAAGQER
jgi:succinyl-diaminopimelate desuccinylase